MNIPDDYFLDTDDGMLEYLEKQGKDSLKGIQQSNEKNKERAYKLLNYLILGIGGIALLLINKGKEIHPIILVNAILLMGGWTISALILTQHIILSKKRPIVANMPQNLYNGSFKESDDKNKLDILRRYELHNINQSIKCLLDINATYRKFTDTAIIMAISLPVSLALITTSILVYLT
ncbi:MULTISPECIES: hypothetical protein [Pasteurellaceae]|uniref:Uncharacterized protein n=1 Tax=Pasteurella atlantica TaxID=2827233 RepID=A0AAW8CM92_9PAST|nr:hypothetical protein [Pasteurella atlantica]MBR0574176.1 hypothetical protein [Pasteurella atlantica]MDP8039285.1 hypothetical protein [Pasteurella atlantica]MDP8041377.1 hypothetical protein [Pasteurella atlantica]MDP8043513.1 hypothetical protein [Pasteurella atlantica]MDP8045569.1 hypothetical protein [Pasteurella atlantica]